MKGKKLTSESKRGEYSGKSSINRLLSDLNLSIGEGSDQADRLAQKLEDGDIEYISDKDGNYIEVPNDGVDRVIRWIVLGESYGQIATKEYGGIFSMDPLPYICDIYDLQVITEVIEEAKTLIKYIKDRVRLVEVQTRLSVRKLGRRDEPFPNRGTISSDEIDYLAIFNRNGGKFPIGAENIVGAGDSLREDTITDIIDQGGMKYYFEY